MALPKLNTPIYELNLPSTDEVIKYRPFLVKDEKTLLMAQETKDLKTIINAVKIVIKNCIESDIKIDDLPMFDLEYILLKIRSKSVGETSKISVKCPDDNKTMAVVDARLDDIEVEMKEGHSPKINLTKDLGVMMAYPSFDIYNKLVNDETNEIQMSMELIADLIHQVWNKDEVYDDITTKEKLEFVDSMTTEQFNKIKKFFETMPKVSKEIEIENPKTKVKSKMTLEGIQAFF